MNFVPFRVFVPPHVRVPQEYFIGEESPGLKMFRRMIPPFVHIEVIQQGAIGHEELIEHSVFLDAGPNFTSNVIDYISGLINDRMGQATKEFSLSEIADGWKLGLPLIKAIIAEIANTEDSDYVEGVKKVYLIHPPHLENEVLRHLSALPVPATPDSASQRLTCVSLGEEMHLFVVEPYKLDLSRRRSSDPRWLIVHLYNPDKPALAIKVEAPGPLTFKEPSPLLSDTEVAEYQAMKVVQANLRDAGVDIQDLCHEPNGFKTFPDYGASLNGTAWDFEITRVLGNILENRRILDKPRDARKMMNRAVQSPPIEDEDVRIALDLAIRKKEKKRQSLGTAPKLCLILLNVLNLDIGSQSAPWKEIDLSQFCVVVLVNVDSHPNIEFLKGRSLLSGGSP